MKFLREEISNCISQMNSFLDYLVKVVEFHFSETPNWVLRKQFLIEQCLNLTEYWFDMYEEETSPLEDIT